MNMQKICEYIINNVNSNISAEQVADVFHYNKSYMMRKFKDYTGFTINEFINECRVYNSTDPLIYTDNSILKIALTYGFNSLEYYSEKFKDIIGTSPLKFRQIYSKMIEIANDSKDTEELLFIKNTLTELQEYQAYLNSIGDTFTEIKENIAKPKIKTLSSIN